MDISSARLGQAVHMAVQKNVLDHVKTQGASLVSLIASAPTPAASVNPPHLGQNLDVRV